ncbi:MAG: o-succinylbenzoate---CoA ligase, partial [Pseudonocardiales bacterium]|nr:o-succinylbenzoate---CoA ligase [Pseudonocardiales bacterium]
IDALAATLDGGPAVLPLARDVPVPADAAGWPFCNGAGASCDAHPLPGVLVATSGSTGDPRLVALPVAALRASATATAARLGGPARWLLALPAEHVAGVQVVVRALLAGAPPVLQDLREGFRPDGFAVATAALGPGRRCTSLVPTQLLRLLDAGGPALDALRSYAAVLVGGAALDPGLRARAVAGGVRVVTTYGMTETAGGCVYDGVPLEGVTVRLDGDGRITLGGPTLAAGYVGRPAETAAAFGTDGDGRREFRTGDLGRRVDGRLEVLGRADDVIVTGGEKVVPAAVERVLAAQPGVRAACVVGLPDAEWGAVVAAAVVTDPGGGDRVADPERLRAAVREALGRAAVPRVLQAVDALPLRGIGKPDRTAVARALGGARRADAAAEQERSIGG